MSFCLVISEIDKVNNYLFLFNLLWGLSVNFVILSGQVWFGLVNLRIK